MSRNVSIARSRRAMIPEGFEMWDERRPRTCAGKATLIRDATGNASQAARTCSEEVVGVPIINDGRARPVGVLSDTAVAASADTSLPRLGVKLESRTGPSGLFILPRQMIRPLGVTTQF